MARGGALAACVSALVLAAACSWLADGLFPAREEDGPSASAAPELTGLVLRRERALPEPEGDYAVLLPDGARAAAGGAVLAVGDTGAARRAAAEESPAVREYALREAAAAAALGESERAQPLAELYGSGPDGEFELIRTPERAFWRAGADGYEYLGPELIEGLDCASLAELLAAAPEAGEWAGVLASPGRWYFACFAPEGLGLEPGAELRLDFGGFEALCRVESLSEPEGGRRAAVLSSLASPGRAMELRFCTASILSVGR